MARLTMFTLILATVLSSIALRAHAEEGGPTACSVLPRASDQRTSAMRISITAGDNVIPATLVDNAISRDFVALLPLTLTLEDYAATEKIAYLPRKLSPEGAPARSDPSAGDLSYYAPWGNLAIFSKDFRYSSGLIPLGKIDSGQEALNVAGPLSVTIKHTE